MGSTLHVTSCNVQRAWNGLKYPISVCLGGPGTRAKKALPQLPTWRRALTPTPRALWRRASRVGWRSSATWRTCPTSWPAQPVLGTPAISPATALATLPTWIWMLYQEEGCKQGQGDKERHLMMSWRRRRTLCTVLGPRETRTLPWLWSSTHWSGVGASGLPQGETLSELVLVWHNVQISSPFFLSLLLCLSHLLSLSLSVSSSFLSVSLSVFLISSIENFSMDSSTVAMVDLFVGLFALFTIKK